MSIHQLKDGRWVVRYPKGRDPERPTTNKRYFGRGQDAEAAAIAFNESLGLSGRKKQRRSSPTFTELCNAYLAAKVHTMAATSYDNLWTKLERIIVPAIGHLQAHAITHQVLDRYVSSRAGKVKATTIHRDLCDIRAILRWAVSRRLITDNPMDGYTMPRRDDAIISPPSQAEFEAILGKAAEHLRRAMLISYYTGLRPGREELLSLQWDDANLIDMTIMVRSAKKGGLPARIIPIHSRLLDEMKKWIKEDMEREPQPRYIVHYHGRQVGSLKTAWSAAKKRAGVTRRLRLYDIRHRAISDMLEAGADLKSVSEIAGHASPEMTLRVYQHVSNQQRRAAIEALK